MPSVAGDSEQAARKALARVQLKVSHVQHEPSSTIPAGDAIRTDPAAGLSVPVGSGVTLFISSGQPEVTVPDVTGQSESAAKATLEGKGFNVTTSTQTSTSTPAGNVISQSPAGGSHAPGSTGLGAGTMGIENSARIGSGR